uniref:ubiquitinyl hydrolase 1 n=1 Tax=Heterorhabditis bacteriophora TaxID=37862 RepID=A0A1I7X4A7_HETBA
MGDSGIWCLIESDPGVFTEMLRGFGVSGVQVEELYTLEEEEFANLRFAIYIYIFLIVLMFLLVQMLLAPSLVWFSFLNGDLETNQLASLWRMTTISFLHNRYNEGEIHFNLMAVIADRKAKYLKRMNEISEAGMDTPEVAQELCGLQMAIDEEDSKMKRFPLLQLSYLYRVENVRRRHNYLPFIIELLKILAKEGKLVPLVEQAQEKAKARHAEREKLKSKA